MQAYLEFPSGWWVIITILLICYAFLLMQRKKHDELKKQIIFATISLPIAFTIELIAVSLNIWTYYPGNWPIILWPTYFLSALIAYQLVKKVDGNYSKRH